MRIIVAPAMSSKFKYYQQKGLAEFFNTIDPNQPFEPEFAHQVSPDPSIRDARPTR
jgi:hypothetical protein